MTTLRRADPAPLRGAHRQILATLALTLVALVGACRCAGTAGRGTPALVELWGDLAASAETLDDPVIMASALALARATLSGSGAPAGLVTLRATPGRRLFLTAYASAGDGALPPAASGRGPTLADSVIQAAVKLREELVGSPELLRLKLDVTLTAEDLGGALPDAWRRSWAGYRGVWRGDEVRRGWLAPSEIIEAGIWDPDDGTLDHKALNRALKERGAGSGDITVFASRAWIEGPRVEGSPARRVYALSGVGLSRPRPVTAKALETSARSASDYLARIVEPDGRYVYVLDPRTGESVGGYNMTRHAGTTFSLLQGYRRFGDPEMLARARMALGYLRSRTELRGDGDEAFAFVAEGPKAKLGAVALSLLALEEYLLATGDRSVLEEMRRYARFLVKQQEADGHFLSIWQHDPERPVKPFESEYYPGEAIFALGRLYTLDPDPRWLETARKGARWLIDVRDAGKGPDDLIHDHWLLYGLALLYKNTGSVDWLDRTRLICTAIELGYDVATIRPLRSAPNATRVEGIGAAIDTARMAGVADGTAWTAMALEMLAHQLRLQFDPVTSYYLGAAGTALGGFGGSTADPTIRIDYVQHSVSALLALERHLARGAGRDLPGAP